MKEQLELIPALVTYGQALVEAGHFYADREVGVEQKIGIEVGMAAISALEEMGLEVAPCILVDDYNASDLKTESNLLAIQEMGFIPEVTYREKDSLAKALAIIETLESEGKVKTKKSDGSKNLKNPWLRLVEGNGKLSCAILDAALYVQKHEEHGGICVTVLPESYKKQQEATRAILATAGYQMPILNVYFNMEGEISVNFDF